jgi:hypothetical protein
MKKFALSLLIITLLFPNKSFSQNNDEIAVAAAAGAVVGAVVGAIKINQIEEMLEQIAVEEVLSSYPYLVNFELKTSSLNGTKLKDISSVEIITYTITDIDTNDKYVLFAFASFGWANEYGVDFTKLLWKNFNANEWNNLMKSYIKTASDVDLTLAEVSESKIVNTGVKQGSKFILKFDKIGGDTYLTSDYSKEFKVIFNERSLGLYLKSTKNLIQIRRRTIIEAHEHLNNI